MMKSVDVLCRDIHNFGWESSESPSLSCSGCILLGVWLQQTSVLYTCPAFPSPAFDNSLLFSLGDHLQHCQWPACFPSATVSEHTGWLLVSTCWRALSGHGSMGETMSLGSVLNQRYIVPWWTNAPLTQPQGEQLQGCFYTVSQRVSVEVRPSCP